MFPALPPGSGCCSAPATAGSESATVGLEIDSAPSFRILSGCSSQSIGNQDLDLLNWVSLPEKMLDSGPKKKNVFSTMQWHTSPYINHFLVLITPTWEHPYAAIKNSIAVSGRLTTGTAPALMLLGWWKACPVAMAARFNISYFHKFCSLCEKPAVQSNFTVISYSFFWSLPSRNWNLQKLSYMFHCLAENKLTRMLLLLF